MTGTPSKQHVELECLLCAEKHLARARSYLGEARSGYPENFWWTLGDMSIAEDHLQVEYPELGEKIRFHRKLLESNPRYTPPWKDLVLEIAIVGGYDVATELGECI